MCVALWLVHIPFSCQTSHNTTGCSTRNPCLSKRECDKEGFFPQHHDLCLRCSVLSRC